MNTNDENLYELICRALDAREARENKKNVTIINRAAVANRLRVSLSTLWRWNKTGYLRAVKYGRAVWYKLEDIEALERGEKTITKVEEGNKNGTR